MRALPLVVLVGCGPQVEDESAFEQEFAERWCARQEECARGEFDRAYASTSECVGDKEDHVDIHDADKGCDLDPEGADACLDYLSATDCAGWEHKEIDRACEDVFDC